MNYWYTMIYCGASTLKDTTQDKKKKKQPWTTVMCKSMGESPIRYVMRKKPDTKDCILHNSIDMILQKNQKYKVRKFR